MSIWDTIRSFYKRKGHNNTMPLTQGKRIANAVIDFVNRHIDQIFTASELRGYVRTLAGDTAPGSADRIMRQLRKEGVVNYELISRNRSQYKGLAVVPKVEG